MVSRDLLPMARGCARPRWTGKPLQIVVDGVPGTTGATRHTGCHFAAAIGLRSMLEGFAPKIPDWANDPRQRHASPRPRRDRASVEAARLTEACKRKRM